MSPADAQACNLRELNPNQHLGLITLSLASSKMHCSGQKSLAVGVAPMALDATSFPIATNTELVLASRLRTYFTADVMESFTAVSAMLYSKRLVHWSSLV